MLRNEEGRLLEFVTSLECRLWRVNYGALSAIERVFLAIWELDSQIYQDGLQLYFFNTSGRLAPRALHALRAIGAVLTASILEKAIALVGKAEWHDETRRQETIEALSPETVAALERLERTFLAYPHDLMHLLYQYVCRNRGRVRAHPSAFRTSRRAQDERSKKKRKRDRTSWFALSLRNTSWPNGETCLATTRDLWPIAMPKSLLPCFRGRQAETTMVSSRGYPYLKFTSWLVADEQVRQLKPRIMKSVSHGLPHRPTRGKQFAGCSIMPAMNSVYSFGMPKFSFNRSAGNRPQGSADRLGKVFRPISRNFQSTDRGVIHCTTQRLVDASLIKR